MKITCISCGVWPPFPAMTTRPSSWRSYMIGPYGILPKVHYVRFMSNCFSSFEDICFTNQQLAMSFASGSSSRFTDVHLLGLVSGFPGENGCWRLGCHIISTVRSPCIFEMTENPYWSSWWGIMNLLAPGQELVCSEWIIQILKDYYRCESGYNCASYLSS